MALSQWGKVYYRDLYAGILKQEPGGRCVFTYDASYINNIKAPAIAYTLPKQEASFVSENGLHPFFDNLIAEGWLQDAQARALSVRRYDRFALLLGFGYDLAGAVSVIDPEPKSHTMDYNDDVIRAALLGRASLSGIQRKVLLIKKNNAYFPVQPNELSTHIAKLASGNLKDIMELEYLTTLGVKALLPQDTTVELEINQIATVDEPALIIKRFDRTPTGQRIHFEEFNQLLGHPSGNDKYEGSYEDMGYFINTVPNGLPAESFFLFKRILVALLSGNTDAHFKNFAMFHTPEGLRLTPNYDQVAAWRYKEFHTIALGIGGAQNLDIGALKGKHIVALGKAFKLHSEAILTAVEDIHKNIADAQFAIEQSDVGSKFLRNKLIEIMEKRWKGSFSLIGKLLSKKQNKGVKR